MQLKLAAANHLSTLGHARRWIVEHKNGRGGWRKIVGIDFHFLSTLSLQLDADSKWVVYGKRGHARRTWQPTSLNLIGSN